ncbi:MULTISPECIES: 1,4-alpha-glucan branching protein GlgB [unclassified Methylophaga]|jgi:1,4-alpha-glucan branching enzyme|uniref:1,4-alpha-glucan branching protein GlgB n=2 Tax=Methylophaga TaxID=40222 RepID=UPI000C650ACA|nr:MULTISPECIES: 1,4-alpha-glucan branching protein GlgB [unclassified Methylophaga]MAP25921.1 1,4-alpha-glucan branching enzyme [Methylophaga sp.]MBP25523.1 1,4-alpha-glucan branching enzyme [Methylophaga sp.]HCO00330.1 1,4-alpha-glucan branching enzyme [Methylophaga sp.]|tara:strand:+ start:10873 stop:13044 length:2172 start_codon:yes stop_codon:yes gene_type:complete
MVFEQNLTDDQLKIIEARHHDPFAVLGRHPTKSGVYVRAFLPHTESATVGNNLPMKRVEGTDIFEWTGRSDDLETPYQIHRTTSQNQIQSHYDPYCFPPQISDYDLYLFAEGKHWHAYRILGSHKRTVNGVQGVMFATWAPNAQRVSVVGTFNRWDGRCHPMRSRGSTGVWELFIPGLEIGELYKFEIRNYHDGSLHLKMDPYCQQAELRPGTASVIFDSNYQWQDKEWMSNREHTKWLHAPHSVYEVHLGSWQKRSDGSFCSYRELADKLVPYVRKMGFTHIELLPITEHPLDISWGYQTTGYYAATSRFGSPDDFRYFVDQCHQNNIGVLLDWVPGHFPKDSFGLAKFDGTALYEHEDPRRGEHQDWGTLIFNYGRNEVRNFLLSSAFFWLEECHIDGLRVDAVASMLYLDYSRQEGQWLPNIHGGRENLEVISFLKEVNTILHQSHPGCIIAAEESTSYPMVSRPADMGGLGFSMKWNMGWMHDILEYMKQDPIHRRYHHDQLTFGLLYAFTENFVLPFSHDEVVHGKGSMRYKMPGDEWQQFANLRLLYTFMYSYPGKKLLFMGSEFGQGSEWNSEKALEWYLLDYPKHQGLLQLVTDLNKVYRESPALHYHDFDAHGFEWIDCNDREQSVLSYLRQGQDSIAVAVFNFTPVVRDNYRIGVPEAGEYEVVINSDSEYYSGSNYSVSQVIQSDSISWSDRPYSIVLNLPPLAGLIIRKKH